MLIGSDEVVVSRGLARGLENEGWRLEEYDTFLLFWPVGSYPRGGWGVEMERMGLTGGVRVNGCGELALW